MADVFDSLKESLETIVDEFSILSGDNVGPSGACWQDVAGTAAVNLRVLADKLDSLRRGETHFAGRFPWRGPVVFPSFRDIAEHTDA